MLCAVYFPMKANNVKTTATKAPKTEVRFAEENAKTDLFMITIPN
jgi:hypothetical protein